MFTNEELEKLKKNIRFTLDEDESVRRRKHNVEECNKIPRNYQNKPLVALEKETLIVSLGAKLKITKLKTIRDWFYDNNFANFGNPYENVFLSSLIPEGFSDSKSVQDKVVSYFSSFDASIIGA